MMIKVILAGSNVIFREGIKKILEDVKEIVLVGEATSSTDAFGLCRHHQPDLLIIDMAICGGAFTQLLHDMLQVSPDTKFMVVTEIVCGLPMVLALKAGIQGFIRKNSSISEFCEALLKVVSGEKYITHSVMSNFIEEVKSFQANKNLLSERETLILNLLCNAKTNAQIAVILSLSQATVATHKRNIMNKLGIRKVNELIVWGVENGYK